jgi:hypothetical protein
MLIIDRFEAETALCEAEDGQIVQIPRAALPPGAREGSCLRQNEGGAFALDREAEAERRRKLFQMQENLFG